MRSAALAAAGLLLGACASGGTSQPRTSSTVATEVAPPVETVATIAMPSTRGTVLVEVRAPSRARYSPQLVGAERPGLSVVVTNRGTEPLDVSGLRVQLRAERDEVAFPCDRDMGPLEGVREPASLAQGSSFTFRRETDCALRLAGRYRIAIAISFGHGEWAEPRLVRVVDLDVVVPQGAGLRPVEGTPDLWAGFGTSTSVLARANARGRIAFVLQNAGRDPISVPRARLALRVRRGSSDVACEDAPMSIASPPSLHPGQSHEESLPLSCLGLQVPGRYYVEGRLILDAAETTLGTVTVDVMTNPSLTTAWPTRP